MGHTRPRYNAKGRGLATATTSNQGQDANAELLLPLTAEEKAARRQKLLDERKNVDKSSGKLSSKKRKRLDKYVDKKLAKDRRQELLAQLATYHKEVPEDAQFQTVSSLGSQNLFTAQEKLQRSDRLQERKRNRLKESLGPQQNDDESESSGSEDKDRHIHGDWKTSNKKGQEGRQSSEGTSNLLEAENTVNRDATSNQESQVRQAQPSTLTTRATPTFASGLKRAADGSLPRPVIVKRRRITKTQSIPTAVTSESGSDAEDLSEYSSDDEDDDEEVLSETSATSNAPDGQDSDSSEESWAGIPSSSDEEMEQNDAGDSVLHPNAFMLPTRQKGSFKAWADAQRDEREATQQSAYVEPPTRTIVNNPPSKSDFKDKKPNETNPKLKGPLGGDITLSEAAIKFATTYPTSEERRSIARPQLVQEGRLQLPILAEEDDILFAIRHHPVIVLSGETGSGKTTQIPQFLYEAGFGTKTGSNPGMIGVTQPRRVAAVSMARRVGEELSLSQTSQVVGHQIRYDTTVSPDTRIKFMTDGVLLRELGTDFLLTKYSVIVIDEAHERTVNTDILLGVLSRVVKLRRQMWQESPLSHKPLRLIIMSATLRLTDFLSNKTLFADELPCITVGARQFPVTNHFSRKTSSDYLEEAYKKVSKIHSRLPEGGILVFLTGQAEILSFCRRLEKRFGLKKTDLSSQTDGKSSSIEELDIGHRRDIADVDEVNAVSTGEEDADALDTDSEDGKSVDDEQDAEEPAKPMHVLPLYALLPSDKQMRVFQPPPEGHRLIVVATNVAETSLTIPNIRYVVDAGRAKDRQYDSISGIQSFEVSWISKASAAQRSGRAGRTGPGHCYRLYSSAVYERYLEDHSSPEIIRIPAENMVLQMKSMHIDVVANFPFPTPPDRDALRKAEKTLFELGALDRIKQKGKAMDEYKINDLGRAMSVFPLSPRFAKMLVTGKQHGCLLYIIAIVCGLSIGSPFVQEDIIGQDEESRAEPILSNVEINLIRDSELRAKATRQLQRRQFYASQQQHAALGDAKSDVFRLLSVIGAYEHENGSIKFCQDHFVRVKAMEEIHKLRAQIGQLVQAHFNASDSSVFTPKMKPPSDLQLRVIRQLVAASYIDQVAVRKDVYEKKPLRFSSAHNVPYRAIGINEDVYIHPSSSLYNREPAEFVCYGEVHKTSKAYMKSQSFRVERASLRALYVDDRNSSHSDFTKLAKCFREALMYFYEA